MDRRWLLLLGSNLARDRCVHAGLRRLALLGEVTARTPVRRFPAHDGAGADYHNALAVLACDRDRAALEAAASDSVPSNATRLVAAPVSAGRP